jgi:Domain of unknown function (DUF4267)
VRVRRRCLEVAPADAAGSLTKTIDLLSAGLGLGAVAFGALPALMPRFFGRMFGIASTEDPTVATAIRSVGIRDVILGIGILRALRSDDHRALHHWLLARTAADAGDCVAVTLGIVSGARTRGFLLLGGFAISAAMLGAWLSKQTRPV